jgi:hypothetical protein
MDDDVANATARERQLVLALFCAANVLYLAYDALRLRPLPGVLLVGRVAMELLSSGAWCSCAGRPGRRVTRSRSSARPARRRWPAGSW